MKLELFGTSGCHLCEIAELLLNEAFERDEDPFDVEIIEIAEDPALMDRYGLRIPVLRAGEIEIDWPFTIDDLLEFLNLYKSILFQDTPPEIRP